MFSSSLCAVLASIVFCSFSVSAAPGLSMTVAGPKTADGVDKMTLIVRVSNTGDIPLKLLNDPNGPLSTMPTNTFSITDGKGAKPGFVGIKAKYVPKYAVQTDDDNLFTVLSPGQAVNITHDLSEAYNFTNTGEGAYKFEANNLFHFVDPTTKAVMPIYAVAEAHHASLIGSLAIARPSFNLIKRAFVGCSASQQLQIETAAADGNSYATLAASYLQSLTTPTVRYNTWFGTATPTLYSTVLSHFQNIASHSFISYNFDCIPPNCKSSATFAYVYPNEFGTVHLCDAFWQAPATGTNSKAGTLVHESSHFTVNGGTQDFNYGIAAAKDFALNDPATAVMNADNHEFFAENSPALT